MAKSLVSDDHTLLSFSILVEGQPIPSSYGVVSIQIIREINKISSARIKLVDGGSSEGEDFVIGNSQNFIPGKKITITAGYNTREKEVFKGIIIKHGISLDQGGAFLWVECKHEAIKMTIGRKNEIFNDKKDSDLINSIIQKYSISKEVETTDTQHPELVQHYSSDWDFVLMRADINGLVVKPDLDKLVVKKPNFDAEPVYKVTYGVDLISFDAYIDARTQLKKVEGLSWDFSNQQIIKAQGNNPGEHHAGNLESSQLANVVGLESYQIQTTAHVPMPVLDKLTSAKLTKAQLGYMRGTFKIMGIADINPGDIIEISGLSDRFNGKMYLGGIKHEIDNQGWISECFIGLSDEWYVNETPGIDAPFTSGFTPPIKGLTTAIVKQIDQDPDGNYRIQISIPTLQKDNMKLWARLSHLYASNDAGTFFLPEINDEVIVGFLNEDPQNPIILGMLYSKKNKAPLEPKNDNPEKAIITKQKLTISFSDEKKIITISTPGNNKMIFSDDEKKIIIIDQHENTIEMSQDGILLNSKKNIVLKADQDITLEAQGKIGLKATQDLAGEGMNVSLKGNSQFSAEGAMAELKGSGQTTVKGGIVMIN